MVPNLICFIFSILVFSCLSGSAPYLPTEENLHTRQWFQDSKFGLFIHWGAYSVLENGEWIMEKAELSIDEYESLAASHFNPTKFNPDEWVALAKAAGMKYIAITTRHHDGFALWHTKQNTWNAVDASPCGADLLKLFADVCHRQDMKLFLYYSQVDWHHPDYFPLGKTGYHSGRPEGGNFNAYIDYMDAQLTELLTGYGPIAGVWFDGMWDKPDADWRLERTYSLIHQLQPAALIGSNHHQTPFDGEDFQMFEKDLPGQYTHGHNQESSEIGSLPLETCDTINGSWGYKSSDIAFKSSKELIHTLVKAAGNNSNFLLNVGPRPDGTIQPELMERLHQLGLWLEQNGESIYGTRGGPIKRLPWGVSTQKGNKIYLHILDPETSDLVISLPEKNVEKAYLWPGKTEILMQQSDGHLILHIPSSAINEVDTIIELI